MANATGPNALSADWLRQELDDFKRLGGEVEETLQKPIAHMLDLVSDLLGIFNLRKQLRMATHRCTSRSASVMPANRWNSTPVYGDSAG